MAITLEQYRGMLADAEGDLAEAREAAREMETLVRFLKRKIENLEGSDSQPVFPQVVSGGNYEGMALPEAVKAVLTEGGRAMHVDDIATKLIRGGKPKQKSLKMSISGACRRRDDLFVKTARNTFGLRNGAT